MSDDELKEDVVRAALTTLRFGRPYIYLASTDSTNNRLKELAADPFYPAGTVLLADFQSAGRGRLDRRWEAPPGTSLLFSVLLRPLWPARQGTWLTMLAGLAVAETIESATGATTRLKWPNDVVINQDGEWRKVCGLLLDVTLDAGSRVESAIVGIGLNVNVPAIGLPQTTTPATSLLIAGGRTVERRPLLISLLERMERHYNAALDGHNPTRLWAERLITLGRPVEVTAAGATEPLRGMAEGTDEWGQLLVRDTAGRLHTITAGDVTLRER